MKKKIKTSKGYRYRLISAFWVAANKAGVSEEEARDFVSSLTKGNRLSKLTVDELEKVVREFIKTTKADVTMPSRPARPRQITGRDSRIEMVTSPQLGLIDNYADALGLQDIHIEALMKRAGGVSGQPLTKRTAQNMIEAMKNMLERGWKPKITEKVEYQNVTWN